MLNVFASWCEPCQGEAPLLSAEQRRLVRHGATLLGVTYLDNSIASEQFAQRYHINYPVLRDVSGNFVRSFGTTGVPETFVINRQGRIQALQRFPVTGKWFSQVLPPIEAGADAPPPHPRRAPEPPRAAAPGTRAAAGAERRVRRRPRRGAPALAAAPRASLTQLESQLDVRRLPRVAGRRPVA